MAAALHQRPDGGLTEGSRDEVAAIEATEASGLTWKIDWRSSVPTFIYLSVRIEGDDVQRRRIRSSKRCAGGETKRSNEFGSASVCCRCDGHSLSCRRLRVLVDPQSDSGEERRIGRSECAADH